MGVTYRKSRELIRKAFFRIDLSGRPKQTDSKYP
jgi:hypothetical protein